MTTRPTDDSLPRDAGFDAAWRVTSNEDPPSALDAAILAAAHREVGAKPQSLAANAAMRARRRWWPLAAAATVAVIAIGVVQRAGHDELVAPPNERSIITDMPAQTAKSIAEAPQRAAETPAPRANKKSESAAGAAPSLPEPFPAASPKPSAAARRDATSATPAPANAGEIAAAAPAPQAASRAAPSNPPLAERSAEADAVQRQEPATPATPFTAPMPPAASFADSTRVSGPSAMRSSPVAKTANVEAAEEARIKDHASLPVNDWIALIRRLRDEGRTLEAARELAALRTAHVDHEKLLPPDLRDWHPAEK